MLQLNKLFIFEVDLGSRHSRADNSQQTMKWRVRKRNKFLWQQHCTS